MDDAGDVREARAARRAGRRRRNSAGNMKKLMSFWSNLERKSAESASSKRPVKLKKKKKKTKKTRADAGSRANPKTHRNLNSAFEKFNLIVTNEEGKHETKVEVERKEQAAASPTTSLTSSLSGAASSVSEESRGPLPPTASEQGTSKAPEKTSAPAAATPPTPAELRPKAETKATDAPAESSAAEPVESVADDNTPTAVSASSPRELGTQIADGEGEQSLPLQGDSSPERDDTKASNSKQGVNIGAPHVQTPMYSPEQPDIAMPPIETIGQSSPSQQSVILPPPPLDEEKNDPKASNSEQGLGVDAIDQSTRLDSPQRPIGAKTSTDPEAVPVVTTDQSPQNTPQQFVAPPPPPSDDENEESDDDLPEMQGALANTGVGTAIRGGTSSVAAAASLESVAPPPPPPEEDEDCLAVFGAEDSTDDAPTAVDSSNPLLLDLSTASIPLPPPPLPEGGALASPFDSTPVPPPPPDDQVDESDSDEAERGGDAGKKEEDCDAGKLQIKLKRQKSVKAEVNSSERVYVTSLERLISKFMTPLRLRPDLASPQDIMRIFSNIELLYNFHRHFLEELEDKSKPLHQSFLRMADFLKMYTQYINGYDSAMTTLARLGRKKKFRRFMDEKKENIMSYLILPIQRIPRYVLLLRELIRSTPSDDPTMAGLEQSLAKVTDIAAYVNEQKRQVESRATLFNLSSRIRGTGDFQLFKPDRQLILRETLYSWHHKLTCRRAHDFMLFTDILLWTTPDGKLERHHPVRRLKLDEVSVQARGDGGGAYYGFRLHISKTSSFGKLFAKKKPPTFYSRDPARQKKWCKALRSAVSRMTDQEEAKRSRRMRQRMEKLKANRMRARSLPRKLGDADTEHDFDQLVNLKHMKLEELRKLKINPIKTPQDIVAERKAAAKEKGEHKHGFNLSVFEEGSDESDEPPAD